MITDLLHQRCPYCRSAPVFRGMIRMHETCPSCGHRFEKEPGYFVGAMYFSYALAVPVYAVLALCLLRLLKGRELAAFLLAFLLLTAFSPLLFRCSRLLWLYFDHYLHARKP